MIEGSMKDRVALLVGATDETGKAIAAQLASQGAKVALCAETPGEAAKLAAVMGGNDGSAIACDVDLLDPQAIKNCVSRVLSHFGRIDILVNNVGEPAGMALADITTKDFGIAIGRTVGSQFCFMREVVPAMRRNGHGRVVNISSLAYLGAAADANLAAGQAAIFGLTRAVALDAARDNVTVNTVVKGDLDTGDKTDEQVEKLAGGVPVKRLATPADIAHAVRFFAADSAKYVTGQTFFVCGGKSAYYSMSV